MAACLCVYKLHVHVCFMPFASMWDTWIFLYTPTNINTTLFCDSYINQHAQVGIYTCNLCSYFTFTSLQAKIVYLKMLLGWLEKLKSSSEGCGNAMYQTLIKSLLLTDNLSHEHHNFKEIKPQPNRYSAVYY